MNKNQELFCKNQGITEDQFFGKEKISGSLYLSSLTSIPEGFNPTVGGSLYLSSLTSIPNGFNPTVGGRLDLSSLTSKRPTTKTPPFMLSWQNGRFILVDSILSEVISRHGLVYKTHCVGNKDIEYIVTDGSGKFSHGDTIKKAKESLVYKLSDRDTSKYQGMEKTSILTFAEAIQCYRSITGACEAGTRGFVERKGKKDKYTIGEMIKITDGEYGSETFKFFFE